MKNILSSQCCALQRTNIQSPTPLHCGGGFSLITFLLLLAMWCFVPDAAFGQQGGLGSAWTAGVNFQSNSPCSEDAWAFDAVEMNNGDLVSVGYTTTNSDPMGTGCDQRLTWVRWPAYAVVDKSGTLKQSYFYNNGTGAFGQVAKTSNNACILAGWQGTQAILVKLDANYNEQWVRRFDLPTNDGLERLQSVEVLPNGNILLSGGFRFGADPHGATFFVTCDPDGNPIPDKTVVFTGLDGKILDCKTAMVGNNTYVLATGFKIINDQDWAFEIKGLGDGTDQNTDNTALAGNTFTDFNIANQFEEDNSALQTHCNIYEGAVGDASWAVMGAFPSQGNASPNVPKPDNKFLWDCGAPLFDIRNANAQAFSYFERGESSQNTNSILKCFQNVSVFYDPNATGAPNCVIEDPCPNPPYCNNLLTLYTNSGNALPYRNDLLGAYVRMSPYAVADSLALPGTTRAISLLAGRNQQEDKRILAATYASLGNYNTAQQYLQQVTGSSTETQDFIAYYTVLINAGLAGRDAYHLTAAEFAQLSPLMVHNSTVAEQVKVLDHILNGVYHPLEAEGSTGGRPGERSEENKTAIVETELTVFPNPFSNEVRFVAPAGASVKALVITDISGKIVFERKYTTGESLVVWQAVNIAKGILLYSCSISTGETVHGKLLHIKKQ